MDSFILTIAVKETKSQEVGMDKLTKVKTESDNSERTDKNEEEKLAIQQKLFELLGPWV